MAATKQRVKPKPSRVVPSKAKPPTPAPPSVAMVGWLFLRLRLAIREGEKSEARTYEHQIVEACSQRLAAKADIYATTPNDLSRRQTIKNESDLGGRI